MIKFIKKIKERRENREPRVYSKRQRQAILVAQVSAVLVVIFFAIGPLFRTIVNVARPIPSSAAGVLKSAADPVSYRYDTQILRIFEYGDDRTEQHRLYSVMVDHSVPAYNGSFLGISSSDIILAHDGETTIRHTDDDEQAGFISIDNVPLDLVSAPSPESLLDMSPEILSENESVNNTQAWSIEFEPSADMIKHLLLSDALGLDEYDRTADDIRMLDEGDYRVEWAHAFVTRKDRQLLKMDIRFSLGEDVGYRIMMDLSDFWHQELADFEIQPVRD